MRIAILADVRANEPALVAVLEQVTRLQIDRIWHIGSLLSYGPDPVAVTDRMRAVTGDERCLIGHPDGCILAPESYPAMNPAAQHGAAWAHNRLSPRWLSGRATRGRWQWLRRCQTQGIEQGVRLVAGTPLHPDADFLPYMAAKDQLALHFEQVTTGAFVAMLGMPGLVFTDTMEWARVTSYDQPIPLTGRRFIACPGAVGQPRDRDPRASFAIWDGDSICWHRVVYDIAETKRRIQATHALSIRNADRLDMGC